MLDECDPGGYVPCNQQAAFLSVPIADTGLSLTYSSQWAPARSDRPDWTASKLGLGGWSVNVVEVYDAAEGALVGGDGTWRLAREVPAGPGEAAVPSYDGALGYVFNSAGRQLRTVDGHLGMTLLSFAYDPDGRLEQISGTLNGAPVGFRVRRASNGAPTALVGIDGAVTSLSLSPSGDLVALQGPAGRTTRLSWQSGGLVTAETDPMGAVTHFRYGSGGLLVSETDPDGVAQQLRRSATSTSVEVRVTTGLGRVFDRLHRAFRCQRAAPLHRSRWCDHDRDDPSRRFVLLVATRREGEHRRRGPEQRVGALCSGALARCHHRPQQRDVADRGSPGPERGRGDALHRGRVAYDHGQRRAVG